MDRGSEANSDRVKLVNDYLEEGLIEGWWLYSVRWWLSEMAHRLMTL